MGKFPGITLNLTTKTEPLTFRDKIFTQLYFLDLMIGWDQEVYF